MYVICSCGKRFKNAVANTHYKTIGHIKHSKTEEQDIDVVIEKVVNNYIDNCLTNEKIYNRTHIMKLCNCTFIDFIAVNLPKFSLEGKAVAYVDHCTRTWGFARDDNKIIIYDL
ncbi:MAG: hypothetical protein GTO02_09320 [Candidatus Dadabacteria bacterium]|nr:hypothetical protein [Candidatus Dadabacteria bacterium]